MTTETKTSKPRRLPVQGGVHEADVGGFRALISEANEMLLAGFVVVGVVPLGKDKLGVVYLRRESPRPTSNVDF